MMNRNRLLHKYLLLALILTALFAMTGCRTRITNNSEVSNVYYDEDGFLTETYQMRRDELGLSTAESPIFPDLGSGDTEEDFDSSEDTGLNYEPEEDTYVDPPTTSSSSSGRRYSSPGRRYSSPSGSGSGSSTTTNWVIVTLDANGGEDITGALKVVKGEKYGKRQKLPTPKWKDSSKSFTGWNTAKDGSGSTVTNDTEVKTSKAHTLYAQWKENETKPKPKPPAPTLPHHVIFMDGYGNTIDEQDVEDGKSAREPDKPKKDGYICTGWDKPFTKVTSDLTITAKWEADVQSEVYWSEQLAKTVEKYDNTACNIVSDGDTDWIEKAGIEQADANVVIVVTKDYDTYDEARAEREYPGKKVIVISSDSEDNEKSKVAYAIGIANILGKMKDSERDKAVKGLLGEDASLYIKMLK